MSNVFFISDTHFGHAATFDKFKRDDGSPLRPFTSVDEMNSTIISNWNSVVNNSDLVYHCGDIVMNKKWLHCLHSCNGRKRLIMGNHDAENVKVYQEYFENVYGVKVLADMILSHVPLHRSSVIPRMGTNVHGHLHGFDIPDGAYYSVCVENINYTPIALEDLRDKIKKKREKYWNLDYVGKVTGNGPG